MTRHEKRGTSIYPDADADGDERGYVPFEITELNEKQTLPMVPSPPGQDADWTVLDCRAAADRTVRFTMAIRNAPDYGVSCGQAVLMVADRETGARLLELFADAFRTDLPRVRWPQTPLQPLSAFTVVLGEGLMRDPEGEGGFTIVLPDAAGPPRSNVQDEPAGIDPHEGGGWTATKWTPERDGHDAHVFFNFNLHQRRGEFLEKDRDDREQLLALLASALRDGPRPERTPETDPNLTRAGPHVVEVIPILNRWEITWRFSFSFSPGGAFPRLPV